MKKILFILVLFNGICAFSQDVEQKIQNYLNLTYKDSDLTYDDVQHWMIESTANSKATKITNYYIKQQYQGVDIFNALTNISYKNNEVINAGYSFIKNISSKVNTTSAAISVTDGFSKALTYTGDFTFVPSILERKDTNNYVLSNGNLTEDSILAELVFQPINGGQQLKLAWDYMFYAQDYQHLWSIRVDAVTGELLEKNDLTIRCNFGEAPSIAMDKEVLKIQKANYVDFEKSTFNKNESILFNPQSASYRVLPYYTESPNHGPRQLLVDPSNSLASPYGWHDTNQAAGAEFTITQGNNVQAQEDADGNNGTGYSPDGGSALLFDYTYGGTGVAATTYTDAALTNLFYMNNIMHDIYYQYGFDETNGNFQKNNYGRGGVTSFFGDYVYADGQDGSGTDNANFSTPVDGTRPRMQMYLWDYGPAPTYLTINTPSSISGSVISLDNVFSPGHVNIPTEPNGITTDLVLFDDGTGDTADACTDAINGTSLSGHIAVIRRGDCTFIDKVLKAQAAGAVAVIIVNNVSYADDGENDYVNMSGASALVTIPAIFIKKVDGEAIISAIQSGTVNATMATPAVVFINSDGDFDNVVIGHEYGHGISTRLTGGPANSSCLNNNEQMGEGWSDWVGLMLQIQTGDTGTDSRGVATFLAGQDIDGDGIRQYPYSTDMTVNPLTLGDTNDYTYVDDGVTYTDSHSLGTVWASMLWDLTWAYINKYGFDPDIYNGTGGNNKVMQLVLDAMKLQTCNPGFVAGRNAIIAADQATTGGEDYCMIWEVFARRGLGVNASSGLTSSSTDQVEDFTEPAAGANCTFLATDKATKVDAIKVYPNPSSAIFNVEIADFSGDLEVTVFDLNGRIVYSNYNTKFNNKMEVNLSSLVKGVYLLQLKSDKGVQFVEKIIKE